MPYSPPAAQASSRIAIPVTQDYTPATGTVHSVTTADVLAYFVGTLTATQSLAVHELEIIPDNANTGNIITTFANGSAFTLYNGVLSQSFSVDGLQPIDMNDFTIAGVDGDGFRVTAMLALTDTA